MVPHELVQGEVVLDLDLCNLGVIDADLGILQHQALAHVHGWRLTAVSSVLHTRCSMMIFATEQDVHTHWMLRQHSTQGAEVLPAQPCCFGWLMASNYHTQATYREANCVRKKNSVAHGMADPSSTGISSN